MRLSLRNERRQVRDGWKSVFFVLAGMACFLITGLIGHALPPALKTFAPSGLLITALGLGLTFIAVTLEGRSLASVGLSLNGRFLAQFAQGILLGAGMIALSAALVCTLAGVSLGPVRVPDGAVLARITVTFLGGALFEELLFRGYAFQRTVRSVGTWPALWIFGALFCLGHVPGNLDVGWPLLLAAMTNILLDALTQGLILLRTGSLALPIGLHFGWNWLQENLGFGVSGIAASHGWFHPALGSAPGWLTGGEFGLEASVFAVGVQLVLLLALLWSSRNRRTPLPGALAAA